MTEIGRITKKKFDEVEQYYEIDWTIEDFFSYTEQGDECFSPPFVAAQLQWYFLIRPNGDSEENNVTWIELYLYFAEHDVTPKNANFNFGLRKVDGKIEELADMNYMFSEADDSWGEEKLLEKSKLLERRSELAPYGILTVACKLRINEGGCNFTSRLVNLSANFKEMFTSQIGCDAKLKVQNEEFPVHRAILASRSSVFKTMFQADMKEKHTGVVDIVDCHPGPFKDFLVFIYSSEFENSSGEIYELYKIAHKYCVEELKKICVFYITRDISVGNVIDVAIFGRQYDINELKTKSQDFFNRNSASVFRSDKWKSLLRNDLTLVEELLINMTENVTEEMEII